MGEIKGLRVGRKTPPATIGHGYPQRPDQRSHPCSIIYGIEIAIEADGIHLRDRRSCQEERDITYTNLRKLPVCQVNSIKIVAQIRPAIQLVVGSNTG